MYNQSSKDKDSNVPEAQGTNGAIYCMDILPGSMVGKRPSLLLAGGVDGIIRIWDLGTFISRADVARMRQTDRHGYPLPIRGGIYLIKCSS